MSKQSPEKGGQKRQMNAVEINACWVESIKKESKNRLLNEKFDFNPKNLIILSDKPMANNSSSFTMNPEDTEKEMFEMKAKLSTLAAVPKQKYNFPQTANQEIGWLNDDEDSFNKFRPKYPFNKKSCPETKYASDYVTMTKKSPYANKRAEA